MKTEWVIKIFLVLCTVLVICTIAISGQNNQLLRENQKLIEENAERIDRVEAILNLTE